MLRCEHPKPQLYRESWENLNGSWDFAFDFSVSWKERDWQKALVFDKKIEVPFCPESKLSGIGFTDFIPAVWYRRTFSVENKTGRILLHFGAVDYHCEVFVNGTSVGTHDGGYASFTLDITDAVKAGENELVVYAEDDPRAGKQPSGKQSGRYASSGCFYTRTTGIWQTVWLEFVPQTYIRHLKITTDAANGQALVDVQLSENCRDCTLRLTASFDGKTAAQTVQKANGVHTDVLLTIENPQLWTAGQGNLYDLTVELLHGETVVDCVKSYFGIRTITWDQKAVYINGEPVFQRLVLDQGFYPDGICTAPTDEALEQDILLSMQAGFNGARLHQKVVEERFLYYADKHGYLVWGEMGSWGVDHTKAECIEQFLPEWLEVVGRDQSHPAIVAWCPFNETWDQAGRRQDDNVLKIVYLATKAQDSTRPCIDTSGNYHVLTDIFDIHDYERNTDLYKERYDSKNQPYVNFADRQSYGGQPYMISEFGGARWGDTSGESWGYGEDIKDEKTFVAEFAGHVEALLNCAFVCGFCYTQLTDVEQERNGMYFYSREKKFSDEAYKAMRKALTKKAAIEKK